MSAAHPSTALAATTLAMAFAVGTVCACTDAEDVYIGPTVDAAADATGDAVADAMGSAAADVDASSAAAPADASFAEVLADGPPESTASTSSLVRVANWSPDAPAVDFCLALHGTGAFHGPFVAGLTASSAEAGVAGGSAGGLAYPNASSYATMPPGQYDARLVVGSTCSATIAMDAVSLPAVPPGGAATIALVGDESSSAAGTGLAVVGFLDDLAPSGPLALRFINAAPSVTSIDVGTGTGTAYTALFAGIPFGQAGNAKEGPAAADGGAPPVDAHGYLSHAALAGAAITARPHGASGANDAGAALAQNVSVAAGSVVSIVVAGGLGGAPLSLEECVDNAGTLGPLSNCTVISE